MAFPQSKHQSPQAALSHGPCPANGRRRLAGLLRDGDPPRSVSPVPHATVTHEGPTRLGPTWTTAPHASFLSPVPRMMAMKVPDGKGCDMVGSVGVPCSRLSSCHPPGPAMAYAWRRIRPMHRFFERRSYDRILKDPSSESAATGPRACPVTSIARGMGPDRVFTGPEDHVRPEAAIIGRCPTTWTWHPPPSAGMRLTRPGAHTPGARSRGTSARRNEHPNHVRTHDTPCRAALHHHHSQGPRRKGT